MWAIIGVVVLAVVITLAVTLSRKDNPPTPPSPTDPKWLDFKEYNPYTLTSQDFSKNVWYVNSILSMQNEPEPVEKIAEKFLRLQESEGDGVKYRPVDPANVPVGANNA